MQEGEIMSKNKCELYDAFPKKKTAKQSADDLRKSGDLVRVKELKPPQDSGRLRYGVYVCGRRKNKR